MARILELLKRHTLDLIIALSIGCTGATMIHEASKVPPDMIKIEEDLTGDGIEDAVLHKQFLNGVSARWRIYDGQSPGVYKELSLSQSAELILNKYGTQYEKLP